MRARYKIKKVKTKNVKYQLKLTAYLQHLVILRSKDPAAIYSRIVAYSKGNLSVLPALWERNIRYVIDNFVRKKFSAGVDFFFFYNGEVLVNFLRGDLLCFLKYSVALFWGVH